MENFNKPKVSIIIPVYNGGNYLKRAIDSALNQTYANLEVIVVNDGSDDSGKTESIALSYGEKIRYYKKENNGVASALNLGILKMKGDYFCWLSHDDEYSPRKVEEEVLEIVKEKRDLIIVEFPCYINECSNVVDDGLLYKENCNEEDNNFHWLKLLFKEEINGNCLMFHKKIFNEFGMFDESLKTTQDYDFWFKVMRQVPIKIIPKKNVLSRRHSAQGSKTLSVHKKEKQDLWKNICQSLSINEISKLGNGGVLEGYAWLYNFFKSQNEIPFLARKYRNLLLDDLYILTGVKIPRCLFPIRRSWYEKRKDKFSNTLNKINDKGLMTYFKSKFK